MSVRSARYNLLSLRNPKGLTVIPEERDAWAFLDAAAITSSRQQRAVIDLVRGLKHAQLWSKMKAIYPFVGGTATTHKFNLKDPRDADAAFRLSFSGGWTHNSDGVTGNGTNSWADSFLQPDNVLSSQNSTHHSIYFRTDNSNSGLAYVARDTVANDGGIDIWRYLGTTYYSVNGSEVASTSNDVKGYYMASRIVSNSMKLYRAGSNVHTSSTNSARLPNNGLIYGAYGIPSGTKSFYDNSNYSFATIGDGLTDTDATNLYNIVQRFQTSLGRQV